LGAALRSIRMFFILFFLVLSASILLPVYGQTSYTIPLLGGRWSTYAIGVEVPNESVDMHDLTVQAMETCNAAQAWFMQEYYPNGHVYNLAVSGAGVMRVFFDPDQWDPRYDDTYAYMSPQSSGNSFVSVDIHIRYLNTSNYLDQNHWYNTILHELGHVLGLGHPNIRKVLTPNCPHPVNTLSLLSAIQGKRNSRSKWLKKLSRFRTFKE
jgi:hypothetical protein